jgi:hypothetical protein
VGKVLAYLSGRYTAENTFARLSAAAQMSAELTAVHASALAQQTALSAMVQTKEWEAAANVAKMAGRNAVRLQAWESAATAIRKAIQEKNLQKAKQIVEVAVSIIGTFFPPVNLINAVIAAAEGRYADAVMYGVSSISSGMVGLLGKAGRVGAAVGRGLCFTRTVVNTAWALYAGINAIATGDWLTLGLCAMTLLFHQKACFAAGTRVVTGVLPDGSFATKDIAEIRVGDLVLTRDENDPEAAPELRPVTERNPYERPGV